MKRLHSRWREIAENKLKGILTECPCCRHEDQVIRSVVEAPFTRANEARVGEGIAGESLLVVVCPKCAFVRLFAAADLGLMVND